MVNDRMHRHGLLKDSPDAMVAAVRSVKRSRRIDCEVFDPAEARGRGDAVQEAMVAFTGQRCYRT